MTQSPITKDALAIWEAGVAAVDSRKAVAQNIRLDDNSLCIAGLTFQRSDIDRVIVVAVSYTHLTLPTIYSV